MRRRLLLLAPIAAAISACVGSGKDEPAAPAPRATTTGATGAFQTSLPTVHWVHATH